MSNPSTPVDWSEDGPDSWSHSRLHTNIELVGIGDEWDVKVTPLPDDMPWHSLKVNVRNHDKDKEREVATSFMENFNNIEIEVRKEHPNLSEERKVLISAAESVLELR